MHKYLMLAGLLVATGCASAEESFCEWMESSSRAIMNMRQAELTLGDALSVANSGEKDFDLFNRRRIIEAYKTPLYRTEIERERAIMEFGNRFRIQCEEIGE